jgi:D-proline reductase (dithiol) PrdB
VGLIQRMVEEAGIPTISMGNEPERMGYIKPPRALLVKFARGSMFGEPGNVKRQRRILMDALSALQNMTQPGAIRPLPYRWNRPDPDVHDRKRN